MEGKYEMPSEIAPGYADIADHINKASTGNEDAENMLPNFFQFSKKCFIILDMPQLIGILVIPFEIPVRRGGDNEVNGLIFQEGQVACISVDQSMKRL
jgi:hypothetical protein